MYVLLLTALAWTSTTLGHRAASSPPFSLFSWTPAQQSTYHYGSAQETRKSLDCKTIKENIQSLESSRNRTSTTLGHSWDKLIFFPQLASEEIESWEEGVLCLAYPVLGRRRTKEKHHRPRQRVCLGIPATQASAKMRMRLRHPCRGRL